MPGKKTGRKKIYVSSAFGGKQENVDLAFKYLEHAATKCQGSCYAPHVIYPRFCNDFIPEQRTLGMDMGLDFLAECDEMWAYFPGNEQVWSKGMSVELEYSRENGIPVKVFFNGAGPLDKVDGPYPFN